MDSDLQRLGRREWWLWLSELVVTALSGIVFLLSAFPSLFLHSDHVFEIRSDQARWAALSLLLLFNTWLIHRRWSFRRLRRRLAERVDDLQASREVVCDPSRMDRVTGFYTRASVEHWLGKEVARARRHNVPLSLVAFHLDNLPQISQRYGSAATDLILTEFADRLRNASRGRDFGACLTSDNFLLVLPGCSLRDAKLVSDRLGVLAVKFARHDIALTYSIGWVDYKPGDIPSDLIKRAEDVIQLY